MVLVDTSVFIDFFHGITNHKTKQLKEIILSEENIAICGLVYHEVLQGIKSDKDYKVIKSILDEFILIPFPESYYLKTSELYRKLRKKGVTIRKSIDVMISVLCIENNISLLQNDVDFVHIHKHSKLKLH